MLNNQNKNVRTKKGFSLIEILQTVILVGIVAGLSVSFFKKVNTDDKLMMSTAQLVKSAINEANVQMCSDETPYCPYGGDAGFSPMNLNETPTEACQRYYNDNQIYFDEKLGYCVKTYNAPDDPPEISSALINSNFASTVADNIYKYTYPYSVTTYDEDGKPTTTPKNLEFYVKIDDDIITYCEDSNCNSTVDSFIVKPDDDDENQKKIKPDFSAIRMKRGTNLNVREIYYAPLPCILKTSYQGPSVPMNSITCKDNIPVWDAKISRKTECYTPTGGAQQCPNDNNGAFMVSEICYRLWDIINHKEQNGDGKSDLYMTCVETNPCINTQDCDQGGNAVTNQANLVLPNGARLYNLSCLANTDCPAAGTGNSRNVDHQHIFIKADRIPDDRTFKFTSSSTAVINALKWFKNNISELNETDFNNSPYNKSITDTNQKYDKTTKNETTGEKTVSKNQARGYYYTGVSLYNDYVNKTVKPE